MALDGVGRPQHPTATLVAPGSAQTQSEQIPGTTVMVGSTVSYLTKIPSLLVSAALKLSGRQ